MENNPIRLNGVEIDLLKAKIIVLLIYGLKVREVAECLGYEYNYIKNLKADLFNYTGAHKINEFIRKALLNGFDLEGKYQGKEVLEKADRRRVLKFVPRLKNLPGMEE